MLDSSNLVISGLEKAFTYYIQESSADDKLYSEALKWRNKYEKGLMSASELSFFYYTGFPQYNKQIELFYFILVFHE